MTITVVTNIKAPAGKVWEFWTKPEHIVNWNFASDDWFCPKAVNDLREGGRFLWRMEAKDGSMGFDFTGKYLKVIDYQQIESLLDDGRNIIIRFHQNGIETTVTETFEAEDIHSLEMQRDGWQNILNNFKKYIESLSIMEKMHFEITINSGPERVYEIMLSPGPYKEWTSVFNPDSRFEGSWDKGSRIHFLGTDKDGTTGGMVSRIAENIRGKFVSIEHLAELRNGIELPEGPDTGKWKGAMENYSFSVEEGKTKVSVDIDIVEEYREYFDKTWPEALLKLKEICERD